MMKQWLGGWAIALMALASAAGARAADDFLEAEAAFKLAASAPDAGHVALRFDIAPGYYLYRERLIVSADPPAVLVGEVAVPRGKTKFDDTFKKEVEYFRDQVTLTVPLRVEAGQRVKLLVGNQGCADKGLCYPPMERSFGVRRAAGGGLEVVPVAEGADAPAAPATAPATAPDEPGRFASTLQSGNLWRIGGVFLLAGLLLAFTPCVLPMIPILSSIIVGQSGPVSRGRGFSLALAYSLGMALVYTGFGMIAGLLGEGLAGALQNAWVLGAFGLLLAALSLSMFGLYELQMPSAIQSRVTQWSGRLQGGQHAGVFVMGGLSALIVGPCVAAPLAGALVYISQTRNVAVGGVALFALASGMSVPLLLVGLSAGSLLPRAGAWMERVKHLFGVMLLAVALWMVSPVLPAWALMLAVGGGLFGLAVFLGAFERLPEGAGGLAKAGKGLGLALGVLAVMEFAGLASGGRDVVQPLRHWGGGAAPAGMEARAPKFDSVASLAALEQAVRSSARPVMVDFYADWCVSCKEFESVTLADESVRQRLAGLKLLRVDVTASSADDKALMKRFGLFGPPALLFFHPDGRELGDARVIGFQAPETFVRQLERVERVALAR